MYDVKYLVIAIAIMTLITASLRILPFLIFGGKKKKTPKFIDYLGKVLPYAIMGMLVVYCLKDMQFSSISGFLPAVIASAVVVVSYVIKKSTLISIVGGTAVYMILLHIF